jgi:hypothetical protein
MFKDLFFTTEKASSTTSSDLTKALQWIKKAKGIRSDIRVESSEMKIRLLHDMQVLTRYNASSCSTENAGQHLVQDHFK